jgi:hypothetical protein
MIGGKYDSDRNKTHQYVTFQILRDGGVGDNCAALQQRVRIAVPAPSRERGDHGEHARRQRLGPRLRVYRSLQGSPRKRTLNEQPDVFLRQQKIIL